jgi:glycine cleavage system aminomethyltransferase T
MALVENGRNRMDEPVAVVVRDRVVRACITAPRFYDPDGARLNG